MMRFLLLLLWAPRPASSLAILVTDGLAPSGLKLLHEAGADVLDLSERVDHFNVLETSLSDYDAVIIRSRSRLGAATLANGAAGKLRIVGRAGVGVDNIDCDACLQHGIAVVNTPGASASAVAELTIGHLLNACREMPRADHAVRSGGFLAFKQAAPLTASELRGTNTL
ncbi:hypothetical protein M885DRAFT_154590 [Pelagophyceae sp. CCMP2097]|nr:hypothetical protein M885DRAFT_154590 [Pelagophyceae sp. CCMP2097]